MINNICKDFLYNETNACGECFKGNYLLSLFFFMSFIPTILLIPSWIIAKYIFLPHIEEVKNEKEIDWPYEEDEIAYENRYEIIEKNVKNDKLDTENCCVCESTPDGLVFMKYNKKNECFDWWGDNKSVKYIYLEAVSRRYVNVFECSSFYIDRNDDLKKQKEYQKIQEEKEKEKKERENEEVDSDDDLFVKLKPNEKVKPKKKEIKAAINGNNYKYNGKIKDFKMLKTYKKKQNVKKKMDFSTWQSMFKK